MKKMGTFTINHDAPVEERIEAAKKVLPYYIHIHPAVFHDHDRYMDKDVDMDRPIFGQKLYAWRLFAFPKGISKKMLLSRMRASTHYGNFRPADPVHMLAFAEHAFKDNHDFGEWGHYVVGLGGELPTVLGAQFGGLQFGMRFFFQHLPQNKWKDVHDGGENTHFLGIKDIEIPM